MADRMLKSDARNLVKEKTRKIWLKRWAETSTNNKLRQITSNLSPLPNSNCSNRQWERTLARLRLGHTRLTHNYLMNGGAPNPPVCEECDRGTQLTVKHILTECDAYRNARLTAFRRTNVSIRSILKDGDTSVSGPLAQFLISTNIIHLL